MFGAAAGGSSERAGAAGDGEAGIDARAGTHGRRTIAVVRGDRERARSEGQHGGLVDDVAGRVEAWREVDRQVVIDRSGRGREVAVYVAGRGDLAQERGSRVGAGERREGQVADGEVHGRRGGGRR